MWKESLMVMNPKRGITQPCSSPQRFSIFQLIVLILLPTASWILIQTPCSHPPYFQPQQAAPLKEKKIFLSGTK